MGKPGGEKESLAQQNQRIKPTGDICFGGANKPCPGNHCFFQFPWEKAHSLFFICKDASSQERDKREGEIERARES